MNIYIDGDTASIISSVSQIQLPSVIWKELCEKDAIKANSVHFCNLQWVEEHEACSPYLAYSLFLPQLIKSVPSKKVLTQESRPTVSVLFKTMPKTL